jgi:hypothetical protein
VSSSNYADNWQIKVVPLDSLVVPVVEHRELLVDRHRIHCAETMHSGYNFDLGEGVLYCKECFWWVCLNSNRS